MIKKTQILFILFFGVLSIKAQQWCPPGASWTYTYTAYGWTKVEGYNTIKYVDTIRVNNKLCQKLSWLNYEVYPYAANHTETRGYQIITHVDQQVLTYQSEPNRFDTIAIFNAAPGAHWYEHLSTQMSATTTPYRITVRDTGRSTINGVSLKYLTVGYGDSATVFSNTCIPCMEKIFERMGSTSGFMYLFRVPYIVDVYHNGGNFVCYSDNLFSDYSKNGQSCKFNLVGISPNVPGEHLKIFPNPSNGKYQMEVNEQLTVKIFNAVGLLVIETTLNKENKTLDLEFMPPGIYSVRFSQDGNLISQKLIKE